MRIGRNLALAAAALAACAMTNAAVVVTQADDGHDVRAAAGSELSLRLPLASGTGYSWKVDPLDGEHVELLEQKSIPPARSMPGATAETLFRFRAKAKGAADVALRLARPWEKDAPPAQTFRFHLVIE